MARNDCISLGIEMEPRKVNAWKLIPLYYIVIFCLHLGISPVLERSRWMEQVFSFFYGSGTETTGKVGISILPTPLSF